MQRQVEKLPPFQQNPQKIISAFSVMSNPQNTPQLIKQADHYLRSCETNPQFALTLMIIFNNAPQQQKLQLLLHLNNVIKRNWTAKRRANQIQIPNEIKQKIKDSIIELYRIHWQSFYKQFNVIFRFIGKYEFPNTYLTLINFITQILNGLANLDIDKIIVHQELLPYLSLIKTVFKQNSKKINHTKDSYTMYVLPTVDLAKKVFGKINQSLKLLQLQVNQSKNSNNVGFNIELSNRLLQCSRKIDKIIMYSLLCGFKQFQSDQKTRQLVYTLLSKIQLLLSLKHRDLNQQIQKNLHALVELLSKLQVSFPFLYTDFLELYLKTMLHLLIQQKFENQELIKCIILANSKPLTTVAYYLNEMQFKQSNQCKKGSAGGFRNQQIICHRDYCTIYGGNNATAFMQTSLSSLMTKYKSRSNSEEELMFQQLENQDYSEQTPFQLYLFLLKNLIARNKQQFRTYLPQIYTYILTNRQISLSSDVASNMYEVLLLLPRIYDEQYLYIDQIYSIMQICYLHQDYAMFGRLIKAYNGYFTDNIVAKVFQLLLEILRKENVGHQVVYQCAVCVKKILSHHQENGLPVDKLGLCIANLLQLIRIYKQTPSYLWNILQLINEILKSLSPELIVSNLTYIIKGIQPILQQKNNDQIVINALSDMLQNILQFLPELSAQSSTSSNQLFEYLYETALELVGQNINNSKIETPITLYRLWLSIAKNVSTDQCSQNFCTKLVTGFKNLRDKIIVQDSVIYLQIVQQYLIGNILSLDEQSMLQIITDIKQISSSAEEPRTIMSLFSLYYSYYLITKKPIKRYVQLAIEWIINLQNKISQTHNVLRTFILLIINHHIIELSAENCFSLFTEFSDNNYLNCKIASMALLCALEVLENTGIITQQIENVPVLTKVLKAVSLQIQPLQYSNSVSSYINSFKMMLYSDTASKIRTYNNTRNVPRKYRLHVKEQWSQFDLTELYRQKFGALLGRLHLGPHDLQQKLDKMAFSRIISILNGNQTFEEKGANKQYQ